MSDFQQEESTHLTQGVDGKLEQTEEVEAVPSRAEVNGDVDSLLSSSTTSSQAPTEGESTNEGASSDLIEGKELSPLTTQSNLMHKQQDATTTSTSSLVSPSPIPPTTVASPSPPPSPTLPSLPLPTPSRKIARRPPLLQTPKSILKKSTVAPPRFNFRRDILQPFAFNSRLLGPGVGGTPGGGGGGGVEGLRNLATMGVPSNATAVMGNAAAVAGTFWGSAMKKLSGAGHYTLSDEREDGGGQLPPLPPTPTPTTTADKSTIASAEEVSSLSTAVTPAELSSAPAAPNTLSSPRRATSSLPSSQPYALALPPTPSSSLVTSTTSPQAAPPSNPPIPPSTNVLSIHELKKVRFRMSSLKVVYPIRGGTTGVAPWDEGATRIR